MQVQYTPSRRPAQAPEPASTSPAGRVAAIAVTAVLGAMIALVQVSGMSWPLRLLFTVAPVAVVVWAGRKCLDARTRHTAWAAGALPVLAALTAIALPVVAAVAAGAKGIGVAAAPAALAALLQPGTPRPATRVTTPLPDAGPAPQATAPRPAMAPARGTQTRAPPPVARTGKPLAAPAPARPAPCLSAYSRKEYLTMQITIAHHKFRPHEPADERLTYRNCAELGEVDLTVYLVPPEGMRLDGPEARAKWIEETRALAERAGHNLCDVLDYCAAYFRDHPNDQMMTLSIASYAEWRGTRKTVRFLPDGTKKSKGYNPHTIQSFNDALQLLRSLRARMTVTYRPSKGKKPITVTDEGAIYVASPVTIRDRDTGETLATAWRVIPGVIAQRLRKVGQYYSLPQPVLALDSRYSAAAKNIMRYILAMHRISGRAEGVLPWAKAVRLAGISATTARNISRTRDRIEVALKALAEGDTPVLAALRQTQQGIAYTLGLRHPACTQRPATRRGVRHIRRVVRVR